MMKPYIQNGIVFSRQFAHPRSDTFSLPPVSRLLDRWLKDCQLIVDPFARNSKVAHITNDLSMDTTADFHMPAEEFVESFDFEADAVLFDPPYSPRQMSDCYKSVGKKPGMKDTQNARLYKRVKDGLDKMLIPGGIAVSFGWNTVGFGITRGYQIQEILLVAHGAAHNDTLVTVERKTPRT